MRQSCCRVRWVTVGVSIGVLGLFLVELLFPMQIWPRPMRSVEQQSYMFLCHIGESLAHFKQQNEGHLPEALGDLVPRYVAPGDVKWFYPPYTGRLKTLSRATTELQVGEIDRQSAYVYLGAAGDAIDCIMYERLEVLPDRACKVNVLTRDLTTHRIPLTLLRSRLRLLGADKDSQGL